MGIKKAPGIEYIPGRDKLFSRGTTRIEKCVISPLKHLTRATCEPTLQCLMTLTVQFTSSRVFLNLLIIKIVLSVGDTIFLFINALGKFQSLSTLLLFLLLLILAQDIYKRKLIF